MVMLGRSCWSGKVFAVKLDGGWCGASASASVSSSFALSASSCAGERVVAAGVVLSSEVVALAALGKYS